MPMLRLGILAFLGAVFMPIDTNWAADPISVHSRALVPAVILTGRVTDQSGRGPLAGARISLDGARIDAFSNAQGVYYLRFPDRYAGREVTLVATLAGYADLRQVVRLSAGTNTVDLAMSAAPQMVDSIRAALPLEKEEQRRDFDRLRARTLFEASVVGGVASPSLAGRYNPNFNTESYAHISENVFMRVGANPVSTFSIDVDRASYANVRRFIRDGVRPPIDAVRIEELINYFPYADRGPRGDAPLAIHAEVSTAPWQPLHRLVRIALKGRPIDLSQAPRSNLVFLLDVSGSMNTPAKLPLLKTAFRMLVDQLRPEDRVAIVVYAGAAGLVLPSTPGADKEAILDAIEGLEAGGSTAGGAGIQLAYKVAAENHIRGGNNRVILATDGDFNVGVSSDSEMIRLIEEKRGQGTFLTVLGFGTGNLKDSKMEQIADHGNGNFAYIDSALEAKKVLVNEMGGTLVTIAKDVKLQVEFNPARVAAYRLIGYENRLLAAEDFDDDTKDAGELGAGHSVTALYEIIPVGVDSPVEVRSPDSLRYQTTTQRNNADASPELLFVKLRYKEPTADESQLMDHPVLDDLGEPSQDFRFASAVAAWGMLLRDSEFCQNFSLTDVAELAKAGLGQDTEGYRAEFIHLVKSAQTMELMTMEPGTR